MRDADAVIRAKGQANAEAGGLSTLSTEKMQRASQAVRELQSLNAGDVGRWIGYWKAKGLFMK
jgi:hypothetical protein